MTTDKASVAMLEALGDELRAASTEPAAGLSQELDEVSAGLDVNALEHAGVFSPSVAPEPEYGPRPFEVRWDPTLDGGDGGWAVYLPTEHLLAYDGAEVATSDISGLTVVQDAGGNDTPWYSLDDVGEDAEHVWLVLTVPDSGPVEAEFAEEEGQAASGERVVNVCVAEIDRSVSDAAGNPVPVVRQSLVGALHLGSGGGGAGVTPDDVSTEFIPDPPSGTSPDGDEGKLQIKDWKNTSLVDPNSLADYSQGVAAIPQNGIQVVARFPQTGSSPLLGYVPLAQLTKKYISAGENIVVTKQGDNIIVSSPGGGGGGITPDTSADGVSDTFIVGGQVSYSASTRKFTQPLWRLTFQNGVLVEKLELTQAEIQAVQETLP